MNDLIKALQIFLKYGNPDSPTHCEHDELFVMIDPDLVSAEDKRELKKLGFSPNGESFKSYVFGSA